MKRRILYIQYVNPAAYPPLEHSARIFAQADWEVRFLGIDTSTLRSLVLRPHPQITTELLAEAAPGLPQRVQYARFTGAVLQCIRQWRPAWVYASDAYATPAALAAQRLTGARVIYHEHDAPTGTRGGMDRFLKITRRQAARAASLCIVPNARRREQFVCELDTAEKTYSVMNCPSRDEVSEPPARTPSDGLTVMYHGSLVPARLPLSVIEALARLPITVRLQIIGYETVGHPNYMRQLRERAADCGVAGRVDFMGTVPTRADLLAQSARGDVGLALMPTASADWNEQTMSGASNKPFDYMGSGAALLVSNLPDWRAMYVETGFGRACQPEDAASIATELQWYLEHPAERAASGARARQKIAGEWNYETQFAPVLQRIEA